MASTIVAPKQDAEPDTEGVGTFTWPPPDDVLQKMAVVDFETGETRPLELEPPPEAIAAVPQWDDSAAPPATAADGESGPSPTSPPPAEGGPRAEVLPAAEVLPDASGAASQLPGQAASGAGGQRRRWVTTISVLVVIALLAVGGSVYATWKLRRPYPPALAARPAVSEPAFAPTPPPEQSPADPTAPAAAQATTPTGGLAVSTDTPGARVWVDGRYAGRAPLTTSSLTAGAHAVAVEGPAGRIEKTITVTDGSIAIVFVSVGVAAPGGITVSAPAELEVREAGRVVGTSRADRILLEPGTHTLDLVSERFGHSSQHVVEVVSGKFVPLSVSFPDGSLNINAVPWAEVLVDGQRIGETPIGNLQLSVGAHEVTFRHPELGEVTRTVDVTLRGPARISVNLERKER